MMESERFLIVTVKNNFQCYISDRYQQKSNLTEYGRGELAHLCSIYAD